VGQVIQYVWGLHKMTAILQWNIWGVLNVVVICSLIFMTWKRYLLNGLILMYGGGDTNATWNGWWNVKQHDSYSKIVIELRVFDICWKDGIMNVKFYVVYIRMFKIIEESKVRKMTLCHLGCLTLRRLMSYIYGAPILDVSRSHTTTQHSR